MKLQRPTQAELDVMSHAQKDALIMQLFDALETLSARLAALEKKVEKNSRNSSNPRPRTVCVRARPSRARRVNDPVVVKKATRA